MIFLYLVIPHLGYDKDQLSNLVYLFASAPSVEAKGIRLLAFTEGDQATPSTEGGEASSCGSTGDNQMRSEGKGTRIPKRYTRFGLA